MFGQPLNPSMLENGGRPVGGTEHSWCSAAVPGGTGIAVLAFMISKPLDISILRNAINKLQNDHPILRSRLQYSNTSKNPFSFVTSPTPFVQIKSFNLFETSKILESFSPQENISISTLQLILEHELNENAWCVNSLNRPSTTTMSDMFFATTYSFSDEKWALVFRLHVASCDRTTAVSMLGELVVLLGEDQEIKGGTQTGEVASKGEVRLGIEDLIPSGKAKKGLLTRGMDMLSYSLSSLRLTNLKFHDAKSPRSSRVIRFQVNKDDTENILLGCKSIGIKLCGAVGAAGLMAAHNSRRNADHHQRKYGIVTLTDCRSLLDPPLSNHNFGFYHSAILNTHVIKGGEKFWEVAKKMYMTFANSKSNNKHFSDMADLNFLMCKAVENPSLTSSSSLRSCLVSIFEDTVIDNSSHLQRQIGVEDYMGCASSHGIGPSMAIFDTIRDGLLDCVCVYPYPLHSREQMQCLVDNMKSILIDGSKSF